ncbi:ribosomal protein S18-alanine N-acetyltransferase [Vibrio hepatarius]|uniref:ribosomal protein S18-alanine N-acetyltransferase n=1 Tax=Vibrio hepatarius TaxID=171383 RepID=UPI001C097F93|nr:ribosomal protein S18-alanine N-acetyltransferase [Vibrio hepatarius]MBU2896324.1 ribosomal protein S18-alanine N-acetyltransferase [Vibrio hepatarius]
MSLNISSLKKEHLPEVFQIETQAHTHPWSIKLIGDINGRGACHHVLVKGDRVVGYFYAQNILGEVTLLNIAVHPKYHGRGYGKALLEAFLDMCAMVNAESAWLEVRESNQRAYTLYEVAGFNEVDRRKGYYPTKPGGKEDAIIMSYLFL